MHSRNMAKVLRRALKKVNAMAEQTAGLTGPAYRPASHPQTLVRICDYRSDTLSKPNMYMRLKMFQASVEEDISGEDPTVKELESKAATMLGKETSLFVPSSTMANLLTLMYHSKGSLCEVIVGAESHMSVHEKAGAAQVARVDLITAPNKSNGTYDIDEVLNKIRKNRDKTSLVCVENTHNFSGGRVIPLPWIRDLATALNEYGVPMHMDGARFFNAVVASDVAPHEIACYFDTVTICLSKGLGCPLGGLLVGSDEIISKARSLRKMLGGGMRQVGIVAGAGVYALDHMVARLKEDHEQAYNIAKAIHDIRSNKISIDLDTVETNILHIKLDTQILSSETFCKRMGLVTDGEMGEDVAASVRITPWNSNTARLVVCCNNDTADERATINKLNHVINEFENGIFVI